MERLRDTAARGELDLLYVQKPDRLARHYPYQFLLLQELRTAGVAVTFLNLPAQLTAEDRLLLEFQGVFAEYERVQVVDLGQSRSSYKFPISGK